MFDCFFLVEDPGLPFGGAIGHATENYPGYFEAGLAQTDIGHGVFFLRLGFHGVRTKESGVPGDSPPFISWRRDASCRL